MHFFRNLILNWICFVAVSNLDYVDLLLLGTTKNVFIFQIADFLDIVMHLLAF